MSNLMPFGRQAAFPSTAEIRHELRLAAAADAIIAAARKIALKTMTPEAMRTLIGDLAVKHGISRDRASMLVDRFGPERAPLEGAAQNLRMAKA